METLPEVSVVIPVFNEEKNLPELIRRCHQACRALARPYEILLVNDGSRDGSARIIEEAAAVAGGSLIGVFLNRNYGQHAAVMAGFAEARGEIVVTLDADLQNPPEAIPELIAKIDEGYDVVGSVRMHRQDTRFRRMSSAFINRMVQRVTGVMMHDYGCMLRAYRAPVIKSMLQCREMSLFIPVLANSFASKTTEIEVGHAERGAGQSKYNLWKLINLQFDLLTSMTTFPLRLLSVLGAAICAFGMVLGALILVMRLCYGPEWAVGGVFTLFALLFMLSGAHFFGMGLLGEYLGRVYSDVRQRPRYIISRRVTGTPAAQLKQAI